MCGGEAGGGGGGSDDREMQGFQEQRSHAPEMEPQREFVQIGMLDPSGTTRRTEWP